MLPLTPFVKLKQDWHRDRFDLAPSMRRLARWAMFLAFGLLIFTFTVPSLQAAKNLMPLENAFSSAEQEPNKKAAVRKWKNLLNKVTQSKPGELPGYISADIVQRIVVDRLLQLYVSSGDEAEGIEAYEYINQIPDAEMRLWGLVYFLQQVTQTGELKDRPQLLTLALDAINTVYTGADGLEQEMRERVYYGLAAVITSEKGKDTYPDRELQRVHEIITQIKHSEYRQDLMKRFGALGKTLPPTIFPAPYQRLYLAFADDSPTTDTLLAIHQEAAKTNQFNVALLALLGAGKEGTGEMKNFFQKQMEMGEISRARRVAEGVSDPVTCADMWSRLSEHYLYYAYEAKARAAHENAAACAGRLNDTAARQQTLKLVENRQAAGKAKLGQHVDIDAKKKLSYLAEVEKIRTAQGIAQASAVVEGESDTKLRVSAFHYLALRQAAALDHYGLFGSNVPAKNLMAPIQYTAEASPTAAPSFTFASLKVQEDELLDRYKGDAQSVMVYEGIGASPIGQAIYYNGLPRQAAVTGKDVRSKVPLPGHARVSLVHYESNIFNSTFTRLFGNSGFVLAQKSATPMVITLENGVTDISTIYDELVAQGNSKCLAKAGKIYTLHCPLIVGTNATLVMSGDDVSEVRLSAQSGSYLLNANIAYLTDIKLTGWDEEKNGPMWMNYEQHDRFRPFFTSWNRSYSYLANSEITALGFDYGKSYGISFSSGPNSWRNLGDIDNNERPTGIIVNNSFRNMMFGFYSYEAYNAVIVGNEYVDNIVYGIDPHDRSSYLVIAYNTVYGTAKKHGIIMSREVNKSLIAGNLSFKNQGAGIMLDRESDETLIYANTVFANEGSGLSLFESNCNIVAANLFTANKDSGVRLRNSHNIGVFDNDITANNHGITAYTLLLEENPQHRARNYEMDPYADIAGFSAVGNRIQANKTGIFVNDIDGMYLKKNDFTHQAPSLYRGDWFATRMQDLMQMDQNVKGAVISRICPTTRTMPRQHTCMFRENGTLTGDGLDLFMQRLSLPQCQQAQSTLTASKEAFR